MTVPFIEKMFDKQGNLIDTAPFVFNVELDELESFHNVKLTIKPLDPCVVITRQYFERSVDEIDPHEFVRGENYNANFFYNDEADEIVLQVFNGFDVALFNMSSLLGIGRIELRDEVPVQENGFAPVHDKVRRIKWTLEEFKQLDGLVAMIKFTRHFILFKGLLIGANYIHRDVQDGDSVPDFRSEKLLRGEKLFLWD